MTEILENVKVFVEVGADHRVITNTLMFSSKTAKLKMSAVLH